MSDDNTIDIGHRLPPVEVRKPWRQKLSKSHAKHIDNLLAIEKELQGMQSRLRYIQNALEGPDEPRQSREAQEGISAALVLLGCAEWKLWQTVPTEEHMPREMLAEFWDRPEKH